MSLEYQINGIQQLERESIDRATTTLERAFSSDPMFSWIFPDPTRRSQSLQRFNRVPLEYGLRYGHVMQVNDGRGLPSGSLPAARSRWAAWYAAACCPYHFRLDSGHSQSS
jgi:hypothetical protein